MQNQRLGFARRLAEICDDLAIPCGRGRQTQLAKMFGVRQQAARQWLLGETMPTMEKQIEIAIRAKVNWDWIMTGRGAKAASSAGLRPSIAELVKAAEFLSDYKVQQLTKIVPAIAEPEPDGDETGSDRDQPKAPPPRRRSR